MARIEQNKVGNSGGNEEIEKLKTELKEVNETLTDVKTKLTLKDGMIKLYEKQQNEIMDILNLPSEDRSFSKVLKALKESKQACHEATEIEHYAEASDVYENYVREKSQ